MADFGIGEGLAIASVAATAVGTGVSVAGAMQAAQAQAKQNAYAAGVARNNEILAQRAATQSTQQGETDAASAALQGRQLLGRQRAAFASNGVLVDSGSALDIGADTAGANTLNELTIRNNAQKQALGFEAQGMNFDAQAAADTIAGQNAKDAGLTNGLGSLLSGAGTVASKWYQYNNNTNPYANYSWGF